MAVVSATEFSAAGWFTVSALVSDVATVAVAAFPYPEKENGTSVGGKQFSSLHAPYSR